MTEPQDCPSCGLLLANTEGAPCPRCGEIIRPPVSLVSRVEGAERLYREFRFPGWLGPVVGPVVGAGLGIIKGRALVRMTGIPLWQVVAGGAAMGLLAGCLIALLDLADPEAGNKGRHTK